MRELEQVYDQGPLSPRMAAGRFLAREPIDIGTWRDAKREIEDGLDRRR